jgi:OmpA-OmpF porin, OOP family
MRVRLLIAAGVLAFVPALAHAQDVPAAEPAPSPAAAHREGSFEFTLGGGFSFIDQAFNGYLSTNTTRIANPNPGRLMGGGELRLTWNVTRHLGLGAGAGITNGNGAILLAPFGALTFTMNLNRGFNPFVELGGGVTRVAAYTGTLLGDATYRETSTYSAFGGLGFRAMLGGALALRVEGRMSYDRFPGFGKAAFNSAGFLGLSLFVGGGSRSRSGGDEVPPAAEVAPPAPTPAPVAAPSNAAVRPSVRPAPPANAAPPAPAVAVPDRAPPAAAATPLDRDRDGVPDQLDRCPNTPPDARPVYPASHERAGCPVDSDNDGVPDPRDRCARTPVGTPVDENGCPPAAQPTARPAAGPAAQPAVGAAMVLRNVAFRQNSAVLLPSSGAALDSVAALLRSVPDARWEVAGFTDNRGLATRNQQLSRLRASMVMRSLIVRGVPAASLTAVGYGSRRPAASNRTETGRAQNRRVEIRRLR